MPRYDVHEEDLKAGLKCFFREHGYRAYTEVRMMNRWVDLVALKENEVVAVELKISDWKQALRQAISYQLGADFTFVAMPLKYACGAYKNRYWFQKEGVGLIAMHHHRKDIRILLEPERSTRMMPMVRDNLFVVVEHNGQKVIIPRSSKRISRKEIELTFLAANEYRSSKRFRF